MRTIGLTLLLTSVVFGEDTLASDCNSIKKETQCLAASENGEHCAWCKSAAVGNTCFKESDATTLPTDIFQCSYQSFVDEVLASDCNSIKKETQCLAASENGEHCAWCKSAAVGNTCFKESDAITLPADVFQCSYQSLKDTLASDCNSIKKESQCLAASENGEHCAWCKSAAVGNTCFKESDAITLPSDIFICSYQSSWYMDIIEETLKMFGF